MYKIPIFALHGFRLAWSYKLNFFNRYFSVLISLLLYFFLDRLVGNGLDDVEGSYFTFLLIGGIFSRFLELSVRNFAFNIREEMLMGTLEPLLTTATSTVTALLGPATWGMIEGVMLIALQLGVGSALGADFSQANWGVGLLIMLLSITSLLCYGIFSAGFIIVYKRSDPLNFVVRASVQVFSGVYFPVTILPIYLRVISYLLPFTYAIEGLRGALIEGKSVSELWPQVIALLLFTAILLPFGIWTMRYAIRYLKQTGNLSHY